MNIILKYIFFLQYKNTPFSIPSPNFKWKEVCVLISNAD